jgi:hypothetical protein
MPLHWPKIEPVANWLVFDLEQKQKGACRKVLLRGSSIASNPDRQRS